MSDLQELEASARRIETAIFAELHALADLMLQDTTNDLASAMNLRMKAAQGGLNRLGSLSKEFRKASPSGRKAPPDARRDRYFRGVRHRLRKWRSVRSAYAEAIEAAPAPLSQAEVPGRVEQQLDVVDHVYMAMYGLLRAGTQDDQAAENQFYPDIPLSLSRFTSYCHAALRICLAQKKPRPLRFLDVGCGVGVTLLSAARVFDFAAGLEYDPGYVKVAQNLHRRAGSQRVDVVAGDALSFKNYDQFDVIYFFKPIQMRAKMQELEHRIIYQARPGTVLIAPYMDFSTSNAPVPCHAITRNVHVTGGTQEQADALRDQAELIGVAIHSPDKVQDAHLGFLAPLVDALAKRGHGIFEARTEI